MATEEQKCNPGMTPNAGQNGRHGDSTMELVSPEVLREFVGVQRPTVEGLLAALAGLHMADANLDASVNADVNADANVETNAGTVTDEEW